MLLFPKLSGEALKRGQEGVIGLRVFVDETGKVTEAIVARSTGHKELDELGVATAQGWKLHPGSIRRPSRSTHPSRGRAATRA